MSQPTRLHSEYHAAFPAFELKNIVKGWIGHQKLTYPLYVLESHKSTIREMKTVYALQLKLEYCGWSHNCLFSTMEYHLYLNVEMECIYLELELKIFLW